MRTAATVLFLVPALLALAACAGGEEPTTVSGPAGMKAPAGAKGTPPAAAGPTASPPAPKAAPAPSAAAEKLDPAKATEKAPDTYKVKFNTTKGEFVVQVNKAWAPQAGDRFFNLVKLGFYDDTAFFRVVDGFMVQFGINGDPQVNTKWRNAKIPDDPVKESNKRGRITFATSGPNSRTTQVFINFVDNGRLDGMGFTPFGDVVSGMDVVDKLHKGYGEGAPRGRGPDQGRIQSEGAPYLRSAFPELDWIKDAKIVQ